MPETEREHEPKISLAEIVFILPYVIAIDCLELLLAIFLLDDFWLGDVLALPVTGYLWFKGVPLQRYLVSWIAEFFPYVGALPLLTIGFVLTVYLDHHPKLAKVAAVAAGATAKAAGGAATVEGAGASAGKTAATEAKTAGTATAETGAVAGKAAGAAGGGMEAETVASGAQAPGKDAVSEEAFGIEKEPIQKVQEIMEKMPEPEEKDKGPGGSGDVGVDENVINLKNR